MTDTPENFEEARLLALMKQKESNLARCYLALLTNIAKLEEALRAITREYEVYKEVGVDVMYDLAMHALNRSAE